MKKQLIIASRSSELALWQANKVKEEIQSNYPAIKVKVKSFVTQGDKILNKSLNKIGGKGLFIKELERALLSGEADLAVHSLKDLPHTLPSSFYLPCILKRSNACDVFVSYKYNSLKDLNYDCQLATSSLRRIVQLSDFLSCSFLSIRGNINTRLKKLEDGYCDGLILAAAGLKRLGLEKKITEFIDPLKCLPSPGQGALVVETLKENEELNSLLAVLNDKNTFIECSAERSFFQIINGNCQSPSACYVKIFNNEKVLVSYFVQNGKGEKLKESSYCSMDKLSVYIKGKAIKAREFMAQN